MEEEASAPTRQPLRRSLIRLAKANVDTLHAASTLSKNAYDLAQQNGRLMPAHTGSVLTAQSRLARAQAHLNTLLDQEAENEAQVQAAKSKHEEALQLVDNQLEAFATLQQAGEPTPRNMPAQPDTDGRDVSNLSASGAVAAGASSVQHVQQQGQSASPGHRPVTENAAPVVSAGGARGPAQSFPLERDVLEYIQDMGPADETDTAELLSDLTEIGKLLGLAPHALNEFHNSLAWRINDNEVRSSAIVRLEAQLSAAARQNLSPGVQPAVLRAIAEHTGELQVSADQTDVLEEQDVRPFVRPRF
ncbi:hypothetical protein [Paraburkholderia megapolitana]|nr:hypothetical protein [Paraburkholderia megapolitana]